MEGGVASVAGRDGSPGPRPPEGSILLRLRRETRAPHDRLEAGLGLPGAVAGADDYRRLLAALYGLYRPLEHRLSALAGWPEAGVDLDRRRKLPLLVADLAALGGARPDDLPRCRALPPLDSLPRAFGCLYVLEGATLGGQIVAPALVAALGPEAGGATAFFAAYGDRTPAMWRDFRAALRRFAAADPGAGDEVVRGAEETFRAFEDWLRAAGLLR